MAKLVLDPAAITSLTGADVNATDETDSSVLYNASYDGLPELVELLIKHGADVNAADADGATALFVARKNKNLLCEQLLVAAGAVDGGSDDEDEGEEEDDDDSEMELDGLDAVAAAQKAAGPAVDRGRFQGDGEG